MSDFKPYQDWTPDDDNDDEPLLRLIKLQQEQLSALRVAIIEIHEHQQLLVQHINENQDLLVAAIKEQFAYAQNIAGVVRFMAGVKQ